MEENNKLLETWFPISQRQGEKTEAGKQTWVQLNNKCSIMSITCFPQSLKQESQSHKTQLTYAFNKEPVEVDHYYKEADHDYKERKMSLELRKTLFRLG